MSKDGDRARPVNAFGVYVNARLRELGMSKRGLADAIGVARSTVHRLLGDEPPKQVPSSTVIAIAGVLDEDADQLLSLISGQLYAVPDDDNRARNALVRTFVLATQDLTLDELRHTVEVANHAAELVRSRPRARRG